MTIESLNLLPCPFCGGEPTATSCDRIITIGCNRCGYHRSFHGLVQSEIDTGVPIVYKGGKVSGYEWYDKDAHERAAQSWNRRFADNWDKNEDQTRRFVKYPPVIAEKV